MQKKHESSSGLNEIIENGKRVVSLETEAVSRLIDRIDEDFAMSVKTIYSAEGRVILSGVGKSGLVGRKIVATMNSTGTPAIFLHPVDAMHGDLGIVRKEDVVILISKSGNTEELHDLILMLKRIGVPIIAMTSSRDSFLGKHSDYFLDISVDEEACPYDLAPTSSTTATLVIGDALAIALLQFRKFTPDDFAMLHPAGSLGKRLTLKINEIMITGNDIPIVSLETPFKETILEITSKRLGTTAVVDENGKLAGIVTDGDLRRLLEKEVNLDGLKARDLMTPSPKTIDKDKLASYAISKMENFKITSLVVVDEENVPIGIVHLHDLVNLGLQPNEK